MGASVPYIIIFYIILYVHSVSATCGTNPLALSTSTSVSFNVTQAEYAPGVTCAFVISVSSPNVQAMTVDYCLDSASNDRVELHDGTRGGGGAIFGLLRGCPNGGGRRTVFSPSNTVSVVLFATQVPKTTGRGFNATSTSVTALAPACAGLNTPLTVTFTTKNITVTGPGTYTYAPSTVCSWLVSASGAGMNATVNFDLMFDLAFGDSVQVFDGTSTAAPLLTAGYGSHSPAAVTSSAQHLLVLFLGNGSLSGDRYPHRGFAFSYEAVNAADQCQGLNFLNVIGAAQFGVPRNIESGARYATGLNCSWLLSANDPGNTLQLFFGLYDIAASDDVTVYDAMDASSVAGWSPSQGDVFRSTQPYVYVEFYSSIASRSGLGFVADVQETDNTHCGSLAPTMTVTGRGQVVFPPQGYGYYGSCDITYILQPSNPTTARVALTVWSYNLAPGDSLTVLDRQPNGTVTLATLCGASSGPQTFHAVGNEMHVRIVSYRDPSYFYIGGFNMSTAEYPRQTQCLRTQTIVCSTNCSFAAPATIAGQPRLSPYAVGTDCKFLVDVTAVATKIITVSFLPYSINAAHQIRVYDGSTTSAPSLGSITGATLSDSSCAGVTDINMCPYGSLIRPSGGYVLLVFDALSPVPATSEQTGFVVNVYVGAAKPTMSPCPSQTQLFGSTLDTFFSSNMVPTQVSVVLPNNWHCRFMFISSTAANGMFAMELDLSAIGSLTVLTIYDQDFVQRAQIDGRDVPFPYAHPTTMTFTLPTPYTSTPYPSSAICYIDIRTRGMGSGYGVAGHIRNRIPHGHGHSSPSSSYSYYLEPHNAAYLTGIVSQSYSQYFSGPVTDHYQVVNLGGSWSLPGQSVCFNITACQRCLAQMTNIQGFDGTWTIYQNHSLLGTSTGVTSDRFISSDNTIYPCFQQKPVVNSTGIPNFGFIQQPPPDYCSGDVTINVNDIFSRDYSFSTPVVDYVVQPLACGYRFQGPVGSTLQIDFTGLLVGSSWELFDGSPDNGLYDGMDVLSPRLSLSGYSPSIMSSGRQLYLKISYPSSAPLQLSKPASFKVKAIMATSYEGCGTTTIYTDYQGRASISLPGGSLYAPVSCTWSVFGPLGAYLHIVTFNQGDEVWVTVQENGSPISRELGDSVVDSACESVQISASSLAPTTSGYDVTISIQAVNYQSPVDYPPQCLMPLGITTLCSSQTISGAALGPASTCHIIFGDLYVDSSLQPGQQLTLFSLFAVTGRFDLYSTSVAFFGALQSVGDLYFHKSAGVDICDLEAPPLTFAKSVTVESSVMLELNLGNLRSVGSFNLVESMQLATAYLSGLLHIDSLSFGNAPHLSAVVLPSTTFTIRKIYMNAVSQLGALDLSHLTEGLKCLTIYGAPIQTLMVNVRDIDLIDIQNAFSLVSLSLPQLEACRVVFYLDAVIHLTDLQLPKLTYTNSFTVNKAPLVALNLPKLQIAASLTMVGTGTTTSVTIPQLTHVSSFTLSSTAITVLSLQKLVQALYVFALSDNALLETVNLCSLRTVGGGVATQCGRLSCSDFIAVLLPHAIAPAGIRAFDCASSSGTFGCASDPNVFVDVATCNFTTACIQKSIDLAFSGAGIRIHLPNGTYTGCAENPLNFHGKELSLIGAGTGAGGTVIDCQFTGRALVVESGETCDSTIENIVFMNGYVHDSGGLVSITNGSPTFTGCLFDHGLATGGGGHVIVAAGSTPTFQDCPFTAGSALAGSGGALLINGDAVIDGCTFESSRAAVQGGAISYGGLTTPVAFPISGSRFVDNQSPRGGAVFTSRALAIDRTVFISNTADLFGGAVALYPTQPLGTPFTISNSLFDYNFAINGHGGAVFDYSGDLNVDNVTFTSNNAGNVFSTNECNGGAVYVTCAENYVFLNSLSGPCAVQVDVVSSAFSNNQAQESGGGLFLSRVHSTISLSGFSSDRASQGGGDIYLDSTAANITSNMFDSTSTAAIYAMPWRAPAGIMYNAFQHAYSGGMIYVCLYSCLPDDSSFDPRTAAVPAYASNTFEDGRNAVESDPYSLTWVQPPSEEIISGQAISTQLLSGRLFDAYGRPSYPLSSQVTVSLHATSTPGHATTITGASVVLMTGCAFFYFPDVSLAASTTDGIGANYTIDIRYDIQPLVRATRVITLLGCPSGEGSADTATTGVMCAACSIGTVSSGAPGYTCDACPAGSYAATAGLTVCTQCPANTSAAAGSAACIACAAGLSAPAGSAECLAPIVDGGVALNDVAVPVGVGLAVLLILVVIASFFLWRFVRKRTLKQYYLDSDATVRTSMAKSPLQREVENMVVASSTTRIGGGVYADVYKARFRDSWVAMKVLKGDMIGNSLALDEFSRETVALNRLNSRQHPGIVKLIFFLQRKPMCIGIEYCPRGTIKSLLSHEKISVLDKVRMMAETASALSVLHSLHIAHLDIKTDNLLLDEELHVKVADFGISRTLDAQPDTIPLEFTDANLALASGGSNTGAPAGGVTNSARSAGGLSAVDSHGSSTMNPAFGTTGSDLRPVSSGSIGQRPISRANSMGPGNRVESAEAAATAYTPQYVDPMRIEHDRMNDAQFLREADLFSFAMVMWTMISEAEPYQGEDIKALLASLKADVAKRPPPLAPGTCPDFYRTLMERCWSHDRATRPTFTAVLAELKAGLSREFQHALLPGYAYPGDGSDGMASMAASTVASMMASKHT